MLYNTSGVATENEKYECTQETLGTVVEYNNKKKKSTYVVVRYEANDVDFTIKEFVNLKKVPRKVWIFTCGKKKVPCLGEFKIGDKVKVMYNPEHPKEAYLPMNEKVEE